MLRVSQPGSLAIMIRVGVLAWHLSYRSTAASAASQCQNPSVWVDAPGRALRLGLARSQAGRRARGPGPGPGTVTA